MMPKRIECYSPLRAKQYLRKKGIIEQSYEDTPLSSDRGINARDYNDCKTSDLIVAYLSGATRMSLGTVGEMAWSFAYRIPLVVIMEPTGNIHDHPMSREWFSFRVQTLEAAAHIVEKVLLP